VIDLAGSYRGLLGAPGNCIQAADKGDVNDFDSQRDEKASQPHTVSRQRPEHQYPPTAKPTGSERINY